MRDRSSLPIQGHVAGIIQRHFDVRDGELMVDGCPISSLVKRYGTPLYVYSREVLDHNLQQLRNAYPAPFEIFYSVKANPNQTILHYFLERDCGLEVASSGEIRQAIAAGCQRDSILFAGPGKTSTELKYAIDQRIGEIHVESLSEAQRISAICGESGRPARIALRINPGEAAQGGAMQMGGKSAPFGIDEEEIDAVLDQIGDDPNLDICGIHLFTGTQILDHAILVAQYRKAIEIARHVAARIGRPLQTIDFGGGLGIPYFAHERSLDLQALSRQLSRLVKELKGDPLLSEARLIVEPGRFLVGEAGIYVTQVTEVKRSRGRTYVIVDGGMHQHLAASGNLGQTIKRNFPTTLVNKLNQQTADDHVDVVGPLCTPLDVLARNVALPDAEPGDLFAVFQSGAYARAASPLGFLSHAAPPEIWVDQKQHALIRRRGQFSDLVSDQIELVPEQANQLELRVDQRHLEPTMSINTLEVEHE